jgi:hypothetical protein
VLHHGADCRHHDGQLGVVELTGVSGGAGGGRSTSGSKPLSRKRSYA